MIGTRALAVIVGLGALAGCDALQGFSGPVPPLTTLHVRATGDLEAVRVPGATGEDLHVAVVWGTQWLPEPLCVLPPESPEVAAVLAAGCRDPLAFTPDRVGANVLVGPDVAADLPLFALPSADVMVGDVTARVAYASLVVYDDRDHSGTLELARSRRPPSGGGGRPEPDQLTNDLIYGASFVAMSQADARLTFREGAFLESGFYPRHQCPAPPLSFSIARAGGFTFEAAVAATAAGVLPDEDPATCAAARPDDTTVDIPLRAPAEVREVACQQRREDSSVRYRQPPADSPDLANRAYACAKIPTFGGDTSTAGIIQLIVASRAEDTCKSVSHYTLVGCDQGGLTCDPRDWDLRANPPAWWPCPVQATP
jgi:hypothetical protein